MPVVDSHLFNKRRMRRLFRPDGRSLIVAMDHGLGGNVHPGLQSPDTILRAVVSGGADAILTTPGILKQYGTCFEAAGVVLRVDMGNTWVAKEKTSQRLIWSVEDALRLGADAVACMGFPGTPWEAESLANLAALVAQGDVWGVPVMAEMIPGGFADLAMHTVENIRFAVGLGIELGADIIKTMHTSSDATFREVTEPAYRPVLVLGGGKMQDARSILSHVKSAVDGGARGAVIGRNVWAHSRPHDIVLALSRIIHDGAAVDQALAGLDRL